jgi:hypothetical protein
VIDLVRLTYGALRESGLPATGEFKVRTIPDGPPGVYLGLDDAGRSHLMIEAVEVGPALAGTAALTIGHARLDIGGAVRGLVDVTCEVDALTEVFDHFVVAVVEQLPRPNASPLSLVLEVFERWRRLLLATGDAPGRDLLASLFGELLVLLDVVRADAARRVDAWVGPFQGRHDLRRGAQAVEVKTTRSHTARVVTIHGEDQLEPPDGGQLHLHMVRLEEVPEGGSSVPTLVDELLAAGATASGLFDAVAAAGVAPTHFKSAARIQFDVRERLTFPVDGAMPRIVPSTFLAGERPVGVLDIAYRVDLDHVLGSALDETAYARLIARLAGAGHG